MTLKRRLQELGKDKFYLNIPITFVKLKNWFKGDSIIIDVNDKGDLVIKK